jgi:hypothetical protein
LLLIWELEAQGQREEARAFGGRLLGKDFPCMSGWMVYSGIEVLCRTVNVCKEGLPDLAEKLLSSRDRDV